MPILREQRLQTRNMELSTLFKEVRITGRCCMERRLQRWKAKQVQPTRTTPILLRDSPSSFWPVRRNIPRPQVFTDWRAPTAGALFEFSPARFNVPSWAPTSRPPSSIHFDSGFDQDDAGGNKAEIESFAKARRYSITTSIPVSPVPPQDDSTFDEALSYLQKIILSQTSKEKVQYEAICRRMVKFASRPAGADRVPAPSTW